METSIVGVGVEEPYRWKDSVQSAPEIRMWVLDGIANGSPGACWCGCR